jgi:hypothetical protein
MQAYGTTVVFPVASKCLRGVAALGSRIEQGQQWAQASGDISPVRWELGSQRGVHNVSPALIAGHACHGKWIFH